MYIIACSSYQQYHTPMVNHEQDFSTTEYETPNHEHSNILSPESTPTNDPTTTAQQSNDNITIVSDTQNHATSPSQNNTHSNTSITSSDNSSTEYTSKTLSSSKFDTTDSIEEQLLSQGIITKDQLEIAYKIQQNNPGNKMLASILVDLGFVSDTIITRIITKNKKDDIQSINLKSTILDINLINKVPKETAMLHKVIPISVNQNNLYLAMSDIYDIMAIDTIKRCFNNAYSLQPVFTPETSIMDAIDQYYGYEMSIDGILKELDDHKGELLDGTDSSYVSPTVRFVDAILLDSIKKQASDIHFEPEQDFVRIRYRLDGSLMPAIIFHKEYWNPILVRIKIMSTMNIAENRNPQDGSIHYSLPGNNVDLRVATHPTVYGENVVIRILDKKQSLTDIKNLGLTKHNEKMLKQLLRKPEGIVIVTGPTGSGKTTTLYSILNYINTIEKNIMTLENPVEYRMPIIRQTQIREDSGMSFSGGVKSIMRQDPDIVFVGEVRDENTANSALRLAMTGHQVFTTLHTNSAINTLNRLIDIGIKQHLLSGALICIIAQRLARKLCDKCKTTRQPTAIERKFLKLKDTDHETTICNRTGCEYCMNTGYKGRIAITEILPVDKELDEIIANNLSYKTVYNHVIKRGFKTMQSDALRKITSGITDIEEIIRTIDMSERIIASNYKITD